ncbi:MAG: late competence development ComFB family protein [Clostridia bacterium]|nr:late competence development ComFB family protein [Clostridia bacterium]
MELINYTLKWVWEVMDEVLPQYPDICKCERCRHDIAAFAANRLAPFYAVSRQGSVITKTKLLSQQSRAEILAEVIKAIETVNKNPHYQE